MRKFLMICFIFFVANAMAQGFETFQKEIDQNLWKPFKIAFETNNGPALNALYAQEVLRVTPEGIDTDNRFKDRNLERFKENKNNGTKVILDFWLDSRHTNSDTSYEVGFYRIQFEANGKESIVYGQFHIVLKKIEGLWKITQDWDTATINGNEITVKDFERQSPIQFD